MSYRFHPDRQYLMPTHFGPISGPRSRPDGGRFPDPDDRIKETYSISYYSEPKVLASLLPDEFELFGEPVITVTYSYMTDIAWLAGRGYNMLGVSVPARLRDGNRYIVGPFLLVLWENLTDPIITGREQLGFNKIFCDLPPAQVEGDTVTCRASWMGHVFAELTVSGLKPGPAPITATLPNDHDSASMLHLRYFPKIGALTKAAVCEPVVSPSSSGRVEETKEGEGSLNFFETRWEDMPTQFHIVEALRKLPRYRMLSPVYQRTRGGTDHYRQRRATQDVANA
jgi:acetoacetate decarboxylase